MSYNVDHVDEVVLEAFMEAKTVLRFLENDSALAEINFLQDMETEAQAAVDAKDPKRLIALPNFNWCSSWSGNGMDHLKKKIIPKIKGTVEAIFIWEGGNSMDGLLIKDGKFKECGVKLELVKPEGW